MVTLEEAIRTVKKEMPDFKILEIGENDTFYFFQLQPKRLWGTNEIPNGGSMNVIWKESGKFDMICVDLWDDNTFDEVIINDPPRNIDLTGIEV